MRQQASVMSQVMMGQATKVDEDGEIVLDADGKPVVERSSAQQKFENDARMAENILGLQSLTQTEDKGAQNPGVTAVTMRSYADFTCSLPRGSRLGAGQVTLKFNGCELQNSQPHAVWFSMCSATNYEDSCDDAKFSQPARYAVGEYTRASLGTLGIGCNSVGRCRVTIDFDQSVTVSRENLDEQAKEASSKEGSGLAVIEKMVTSSDYKQELATAGRSAKECYEANLASIELTGKGISCDGTQEVDAGVVADTQECSVASDCLNSETRTASFVRQCTRTFPLTDYTCQYELKTKTCNLSSRWSPRAGKMETTSSCSEDDTTNMVLVHTGEKTCHEQAPEGANLCLSETWSEYWVDRENPTRAGECIAAPYPLESTPMASCRMGGTGAYSGCEEGGWFGRTLPDYQCAAISMSDPDDVVDLTFEQKEGCGICTKPIYIDSCYARPTENEPLDTCSWVFADGLNCTLQSSQPLASYEGQTLSQTDSYLCEKSETVCTEWAAGKNCAVQSAMNQMSSPVFTSQSSLASFNEAMVAAATITALSQEGDLETGIPRVFGGEKSTCRKPRNSLAGLIANDCCRTNLDRPGGNRPSTKCNIAEVELAAAKRSNYTVYLGTFCAKKTLGICRTIGQGYCKFEGLLPKLVQEQGRQQLAEMVASGFGASVETATLSFNYYHSAGGWSAPISVNGVHAAAWQYPQYCENPEEAEKVLTSNPGALGCSPTLNTYLALCDNPNGCGALPATPEAGDELWNIHPIDPLNPAPSAVSRYAAASGQCDTQSGICTYRISAWPAGVGGKAMVTRDMVFPLTAPEAGGDSWTNVGEVLLRPYSNVGDERTARNSKMAPTVRIDYSLNEGWDWQTLTVPTKGAVNVQVPGTDVVLTGECHAFTNTCEYRAAGTVVATLKPWGSPKNPDCTGFTLSQLSLLDFARMDFSEWLVSVMGKVGTPNASELAEAAAVQAQEFLELYQSTGDIQVTRPQAVQTAKITPLEKFGPFEAYLEVADNWPVRYPDGDERNNDPITSVKVDWGDCSIPEFLTRAQGVDGGAQVHGFVGRHWYKAPDEIPVACGGGEHNIRHVVRLTIEAARTGRHDVVLNIRNVWTRFEGTVGANEPGGGTTTHVDTIKVPNRIDD